MNAKRGRGRRREQSVSLQRSRKKHTVAIKPAAGAIGWPRLRPRDGSVTALAATPRSTVPTPAWLKLATRRRFW